MRPLLEERLRRLTAKRARVEARALDELTQIDRQIVALDRLMAQWDTMTPDAALQVVAQAGLTVQVQER